MKKLAAKIQGSDKRKPFTASEEGQELKQHAEYMDDVAASLKDVAKRMEALHKARAQLIEQERSIGDVLLGLSNKLQTQAAFTYSAKVTRGTPTPYLSLQDVTSTLGTYYRQSGDAQADLTAEETKHVVEPLKAMYKARLSEYLEPEHKFDKSYSQYQQTLLKVQNLQEKSKVNATKLEEARHERDQAKDLFDMVQRESLRTIQRNEWRFEIEAGWHFIHQFHVHQVYDMHHQDSFNSIKSKLAEFSNVINKNVETCQTETGREFIPTVQNSLAFEVVDTSIGAETAPISRNVSRNPEEFSADRKQKILQELVSTEQRYNELLRNVCMNYMPPLKKYIKESGSAKIEGSDAVVFSNLKSLYGTHQKLLEQFRDNLAKQSNSIPVGNCLMNAIPELKDYVAYVDNFAQSQQMVKDWRKDKKGISHLLKQLEKKDVNPGGGNLSQLLLAPLKRLHQYEFYANSLFDITPSDDPEFSVLDDVVHELSILVKTISDRSSKARELSRVMETQQKISGLPEILHSVFDNDSVLLREGTLAVLEEKASSNPSDANAAALLKHAVANGASTSSASLSVEDSRQVNYYFFIFSDVIIATTKTKMTEKLRDVSKAVSRKTESTKSSAYRYQYHRFFSEITTQVLPDTNQLKNTIELLNKSTQQRDILCFISPAERVEWHNVLKEGKAMSKQRQVFGIEIDQICQRDNRDIPTFFDTWIHYLLEHGVKKEGILRLSGNATAIALMKCQENRGITDVQGQDAHAVSGLFKLWLRELPTPLLTNDLYDQWIHSAEIGVSQSSEGDDRYQPNALCLEALEVLVSRLPQPNRFILAKTMQLLYEIDQNQDKTKMAKSQIAIVMGPCLLRNKSGNLLDVGSVKKTYGVVIRCIQYYRELFAPVMTEIEQFEKDEQLELQEKSKAEVANREAEKQRKLQQRKVKESAKAAEEETERLRRQEEQKIREERERSEREAKIRAELEEEKTRQKIKKELEDEELQQRKEMEKKLKREKKKKEKAMKEKLEREAEEYKRLLKLEEEELLQRKKEQEAPGSPRLKKKPSRKRSQTLDSEDEPAEPPPAYTPGQLTSEFCFGCRQVIDSSSGEKAIHALERKWHARCFVCGSCREKLTGSFMVMDGVPYCDEDYKKLHSKICAGCNQPIKGQFWKAMDKTWHEACFVCSVCQGTLSNGYFPRKGKPVCKNCT